MTESVKDVRIYYNSFLMKEIRRQLLFVTSTRITTWNKAGRRNVYLKKSILDKKYIHVYQWLLSFLRGYFCSFFAVLLMILGTSVCLLFIPQYFNILLNYIIGSQREMFLFKISCLILLLTVIFIITLNVGKNIIQKNMQEKIFRQMHRLGIPYYERHNVGESLSYLTSEVDAIQDFYRVILPNIIQNMIFFFQIE